MHLPVNAKIVMLKSELPFYKLSYILQVVW